MHKTTRRSKPSRKAAKKPRAVLAFQTAPAPPPARCFQIGRSLLSGVSSMFTVGGPRKAASQHDSAPGSPLSGVGSAASREVSPHLPSLRHREERAGAVAASAAQNPPGASEMKEEKTARAPEKEEESAAPTQAALAPFAAIKEENASPLSRAPQKQQESAANAQAGLAPGQVLPSATGSSPTAVSTSSALDAGEGGAGEGEKGETSSIYIFKGKRNGPQPRKFDMFHGDSPDCAPKVASLSVLRCVFPAVAQLTLRSAAGYVLDPTKPGPKRQRLAQDDIQKWRRLVKACERILLSGSRGDFQLSPVMPACPPLAP